MSEAIEKITVVLGEYKGIKLPKMEVTVTEEEVQEELKRAQQMAATKEPKDGAAETGDETVIDFVGYKDGVAFPGGDGSDYPLVLGSGSFIPGFEEQLVGSKKGDHVEVKVTFPANYHAEDLAGAEAVFQVDVKEVRSAKLPEIGDEMAQKVSPCKTLEEFKEYVRNEIKKYKSQQLASQREDMIVSKIMETSTVEVPEKDIQVAADNLKQNFKMQLMQAGQNLEAYLQSAQMTQEQFDQSAVEQATMMIKGQSVLAEIAKRENIVVTDEELEKELSQMAMNYQMEVDKLKEAIGEHGLELVRQDISGSKAMDLMLSLAEEA